MRAIREAVEQSAKWTQPNEQRREYELRVNEEVLATIRWVKMYGSLVSAEAADGRWTFKRVGFFSPRITVRAAGSEVQIAEFKPGWKGDGVLKFSAGERYEWHNTSFLRSEWAFRNEAQQDLVKFKPEFPPLRHAAEVKIEPCAISMRELSLLILLGWYFMLLMAEDAESGDVIS